jgi:hypothetical protein
VTGPSDELETALASGDGDDDGDDVPESCLDAPFPWARSNNQLMAADNSL